MDSVPRTRPDKFSRPAGTSMVNLSVDADRASSFHSSDLAVSSAMALFYFKRGKIIAIRELFKHCFHVRSRTHCAFCVASLSLSARIASSSARVETNPSCGTVASTAFVILIYTTRSYTLAVSVCAYTRGEDERKRVAKMMKTRSAYL